MRKADRGEERRGEILVNALKTEVQSSFSIERERESLALITAKPSLVWQAKPDGLG